MDRERIGRKTPCAHGLVEPARGMGHRPARASPQESLCLLLALGDAESVWLRALRGDRTPDADEAGIVCFITVAGFLNGPGFEKMRDDLRHTCSDIWVIDCSPEGHEPDVPTRIFQGVQQPVCITLAAQGAEQGFLDAGAGPFPRPAEGTTRGQVRRARGAAAGRSGLGGLPVGLARAIPAELRWKVGRFRPSRRALCVRRRRRETPPDVADCS